MAEKCYESDKREDWTVYKWQNIKHTVLLRYFLEYHRNEESDISKGVFRFINKQTKARKRGYESVVHTDQSTEIYREFTHLGVGGVVVSVSDS